MEVGEHLARACKDASRAEDQGTGTDTGLADLSACHRGRDGGHVPRRCRIIAAII